MAVEKLPGGGWRCRWRDSQGRPRSKGSKDWRKADALKFERQMLQQRDSGLEANAGDMTVGDLADLWMQVSRRIKPATVVARQTHLKRIKPNLGRIRLEKLSGTDIDLHLAKLDEAGLSQATIENNFVQLKAMLNFAVKRGLLIRNPAKLVEAPRVDGREKVFLSFDQLEQLAAAFPERYRNLIMFTGTMGARWSEVWAMLPGDVDGNQILIRGTKSKSSLRRITMPLFVVEFIDDQLERFASDSAIWTDHNGQPAHPEVWRQKIWTPSLKASGLPHMRFHDLRHTAAALAIRAGSHPLLIQRRLGHSSISITLGTYGHLFPEADAEVAEGLDLLWGERKGKPEDPEDKAA